jgi:hypothetical protein
MVLKMGTLVRLLLNLSSIVIRDWDNSFFSSWILYGMSTTLLPESKTFLLECTISCEYNQHFHNFWTSCNDCSTRNVWMHTTYYNMVINIGGSRFVIGRLHLYVVRRTIFTTRKGFVAISRKCWTELEQICAYCWTEVLKTRCMLGACWAKIVLLSFELATQLMVT